MINAKVPVVPGYHEENQDPMYLREQATYIGYKDSEMLKKRASYGYTSFLVIQY